MELINDDETVNLVTRQNKDDTTAAKLVELQKLSQFHIYDEVKDYSQQTLSTRWVITNKEGQTKARLVVRGFEEEFTMPRDSPTVGKGTMGIFWLLHQSRTGPLKQQTLSLLFCRAEN